MLIGHREQECAALCYLLEEYGISVNADAAVRALADGAASPTPPSTGHRRRPEPRRAALRGAGARLRAAGREIPITTSARKREQFPADALAFAGAAHGRGCPDRRSAVRAVLRDAERAEVRPVLSTGKMRIADAQGATAAKDEAQGRGAGEGVRVGIGAYGER